MLIVNTLTHASFAYGWSISLPLSALPVLQVLICSPALVSYITGDWLILFLVSSYSVLLSLLSIPATFQFIAAAPAYKEAAFAVVRLGKAFLAMLVAATPVDSRWLPLRLWGSSGLPARWKLWINLAWFACMVQVSVRL